MQEQAPLVEFHKGFAQDVVNILGASKELLLYALVAFIFIKFHDTLRDMVTPNAVGVIVSAMREAQGELVLQAEGTPGEGDDLAAELAGYGVDVLVAALKSLGYPVPDETVVEVDNQVFSE